MKNSGFIGALIVGIFAGYIGHWFVMKPKPQDVSVLPVDRSIDYYQRFMQQPFSSIDTIQQLRDSNRITRISLTQDMLGELVVINQLLDYPEVIRMYFGEDKNGKMGYMTMAYDLERSFEKGMKDKSNQIGNANNDRGGNQTDQIYFLSGPVNPTCPIMCDNEQPYSDR